MSRWIVTWFLFLDRQEYWKAKKKHGKPISPLFRIIDAITNLNLLLERDWCSHQFI
jgi:hypothetical protein